MSTKIRMIIRSFKSPYLDNFIDTLPSNAKKVNLPESRVVYTVLRSPHIDKKSREQFEIRSKKKVIDIPADRHELRYKFFWLKRQKLFGAQCEFQFFYKTRLSEDTLFKIKSAAVNGV